MDPLDGPEHLPFPATARVKTRKAYDAPRASLGVPAPQAVVAVLAAAIAGAAAWIVGARHAPVAVISPRFETPVMRAVQSDPVSPESPRPLLERAAAAPAPARVALPEPPVASAYVPSAPRARTIASAKAPRLFNQQVGGFVPFKEKP
jgi:hypothetical protein